MAKIKVNKTSLLLASAAAGLMTFGVVASASNAIAAGDEVPCYGVNKCKGTGECGGKGHSCHGQNECAGHGWLKLDKEKCLKIKGGRLKAEAEPAAE
jgi:uncharacterized membrane protein